MREAVVALIRLGQMPGEHGATEETVGAYERHVRALESPAFNDEARGLVSVLPADQSTLFGLAWSVVHFIETAPDWPDPEALDDRSWWAVLLRERAEHAGGPSRS